MDHSIYLKMREVEDHHWWFAGRRRIVQSVLTSLALPQQADILDAGSGTGGSLTLLGQFGQVKGMELDATARELANQRKRGEVLAGSLPDAIPYPAQSFDLVVLLDVLEHIEDDRACLAILATLLKPAGRILLTVPAFPMLWGPHDEAHHHKRRYRANQLRDVITQAGLELDYISYFNTSLFPLISAIRLLQRLLPSENVARELTIPPPFINSILTALFASERLLLPRFSLPFGVSLLAVLKSSQSD